MATHAIGKLKFNLSGEGLAYRWGDGDVHRLFKGKKAAADDEYMDNPDTDFEDGAQDDFDAREDYDGNDGYADDDQYAYEDYDDGYEDDGYADEDRYADDDYADDDRYADDDYADDGDYDDDRYDDDDYADDGDYDDDRYDDDRYDDDDYADGDYDDGYDDGYEDDYGDGGQEAGGQGGLTGYVDQHDWVTYALLFLLPPLGIYLLWRRGRFDKPIRWAITAASAIWFVVALILLLHSLFGGSGDKQAQPTITIPPLSPAATLAPIADTEPEATPDTGAIDDGTATADDLLSGLDADVSPSPTPLTGGVSGTTDTSSSGDYVYSPATGLYYHSYENCPSIPDGVSVWRVTLDIAQNSRHQSACPECIGGGTGTTYYATKGGKHYHLDATCSGMTNATTYTKEAAEKEGKTACPVCITKEQSSLGTPVSSTGVFINGSTTDKSGISVYATKGGQHYHVKSNCSGMSGAVKGSLKNAILAGKTPCPTCCAAAGTMVYCTENGNSYHIDKNCQGMKGAKQVTLAEALVLGKAQCAKCIKGSIVSAATASGSSGASSASSSGSSKSSSDGETYVYATKDGKYYHTNSSCSGMKNATRVTLKSMVAAGRAACPVCAASANTQVYATKGGKYYHSYATCSDMKNASSGTLAQAIAAGYKRCPKCWNSGSGSGGGSSASASSGSSATAVKASAAKSTATASNTYVYATREGTYYHIKSNCSGMSGASRVTLNTAIRAGKKACPICAAAANRTVYSAKDGKHYHAASSCEKSGLKKGTKRTLAEALMLNQTACPYCMTKTSSAGSSGAAQSTTTAAVAAAAARRAGSSYKAGTSGIRVYATLSSKYYHTKRSCGGMTNASRVTLETALNYGKKPCPKCAASAGRTVYATQGGKYYHYSKSDAGSGARRGTLAAALAYGFDPCPNCVTRTSGTAAKTTYTSGKSGIKVYATASSKYYHANASCSGMTGALRVTLETALNYGKKACPVCLSAANTKVYAKAGDKYYHFYKAHAGSGATAGTLAEAKAYGLKPCPNCSVSSVGSRSVANGGSVGAPVSTKAYSAAAESAVYIDPTSANNYYHKSANCSGAGFSGGTKVTLMYARDWGYKACPFCQPPTEALPESTEM